MSHAKTCLRWQKWMRAHYLISKSSLPGHTLMISWSHPWFCRDDKAKIIPSSGEVSQSLYLWNRCLAILSHGNGLPLQGTPPWHHSVLPFIPPWKGSVIKEVPRNTANTKMRKRGGKVICLLTVCALSSQKVSQVLFFPFSASCLYLLGKNLNRWKNN